MSMRPIKCWFGHKWRWYAGPDILYPVRKCQKCGRYEVNFGANEGRVVSPEAGSHDFSFEGLDRWVVLDCSLRLNRRLRDIFDKHRPPIA